MWGGSCCIFFFSLFVSFAATRSFLFGASSSPTGAPHCVMASDMSSQLATNVSPPSASQALDFLRVVGKLKTLKRTGWVNNKVALPESVADHMYRMAMCSFLITDPALDRTRLMKLAVVHDLAEALVGDIVPHDERYTKELKRTLEEVRNYTSSVRNYFIHIFDHHSRMYCWKPPVKRDISINVINRPILPTPSLT